MSGPDILLSKNGAPEKEDVTQEGTAAGEGTVTQEGTAAEEGTVAQESTAAGEDGVVGNGSEGRKDEEDEKKPEAEQPVLYETAGEAYLAKCEELQRKYGEGRLVETAVNTGLPEDGSCYLDGLCMTDFVDFNGDGVQDLLVVYHRGEDSGVDAQHTEAPKAAEYCVEVWTWKEGQLKALMSEEHVSSSRCYQDAHWHTDNCFLTVFEEERRAVIQIYEEDEGGGVFTNYFCLPSFSEGEPECAAYAFEDGRFFENGEEIPKELWYMKVCEYDTILSGVQLSSSEYGRGGLARLGIDMTYVLTQSLENRSRLCDGSFGEMLKVRGDYFSAYMETVLKIRHDFSDRDLGVALRDMDGNGVPELLVALGPGEAEEHCQVYTYAGGQAVKWGEDYPSLSDYGYGGDSAVGFWRGDLSTLLYMQGLEGLDLVRRFEEAASVDADTEYQYVYEDLDRDGSRELLAVVEGEQGYQVWYCADGSAECEMVCELNQQMDCYRLELLRMEGETHVAVNAYNMMGDAKYYSIMALKDGSVESLVSENWGYVYLNGEGEIVLDVEAYDGYYMADMGFYSTHTWKDTYLYYDGEKYREYGAVKLTEEEFAGRYENGSDILDEIRGKTETAQGESLVFPAIFVRGNGIVQIQCEHRYAGGDIHFFYYELRVGGDNRLFGMGMPNDGQMGAVLSGLEAVFPE